MQIIELLTPAYEVAWLPWAVQYFFLVGIATGAALLTSACVYGAMGSLRQRLLPTAVLTLAMSGHRSPSGPAGRLAPASALLALLRTPHPLVVDERRRLAAARVCGPVRADVRPVVAG